MWDSIWINAHLATLRLGKYGAIRRAALAVDQGRIAWVGVRADLPGAPAELAREVHDCEGRWITPGLIDCHTHLVYAGNCAREFELRLQGASDEEIARSGGGIASTLRESRDASEMELIRSASARLKRLMDEGVTTVEIKSGYGLDALSEMKMLRVARLLGESGAVTVKTTFLGAHALPPEYQGRADAYIELVCGEMLPAVAEAKLADAVDAVCDSAGFSPQQTRRLFEAACALHLPVKLHADQFSDANGAALAACFGALSADHLEYANEAGVRAMAEAGTVAVLLPGSHYFLREKQLPPLGLLRRHGVPIAVATDCNPGSSPVTSILVMLNMACTLFKLTPEEALAGITCHAALALGLAATHGTLEVGKVADFALWAIEEPAELAYALGASRVHEARALGVHALLIGVAMGLAFTLLALLLGPPIYRALGGKGAALAAALAYSNVLFAGAVLTWLANTLASILRGTGNMLVPALVLICASLVHVPLSGMLVLGAGPMPQMGIAGAGVAFVCAFGFASLTMLVYLLRRARADLKIHARMFREILRVGAISSVNALQTVFTAVILTGIVGRFGTAALAGYGVGVRLELLQIPLVFAIGHALVPHIGINIGAGQGARAKRIAWAGTAIAASVSLAIGLFVAIFPAAWVGLFSSDASVLDAGSSYLRIVGPFYPFLATGVALYFASQGAGRMAMPVVAGTLRLALALAGGLAAVALGAPLAVIFAVIAFAMMVYGLFTGLAVLRSKWPTER